MSALSNFLLSALVSYGAPAFGLALLLGAVGIPMAGSLLVIATGAFVRQGYLDGALMTTVGLCGVVAGDLTGYWIGHFAGRWAERRFGSSSSWQKAQVTFQQQGGWAVFTSRWLFTALEAPTNLIAGASHYPFRRFVLYDISGEVIWLLLYGGAGYIFGSEWQLVSDFMNNFGWLLLAVAAVAVGVSIWLNLRTEQRKARQRRATESTVPTRKLAHEKPSH